MMSSKPTSGLCGSLPIPPPGMQHTRARPQSFVLLYKSDMGLDTSGAKIVIRRREIMNPTKYRKLVDGTSRVNLG
jgi:hypothetical protein